MTNPAEKLRALLEVATPLPLQWEVSEQWLDGTVSIVESHDAGKVYGVIAEGLSPVDADLSAAAVNTLPLFIELLELLDGMGHEFSCKSTFLSSPPEDNCDCRAADVRRIVEQIAEGLSDE